VSSYNILSATLSDPARFTHCTVENCNPENRFPKILKKLEAQVKARSIIALQEVSLKWVGPLSKFFSDNHYQLVVTNYGNIWNDYMGVAIAYPQMYSLTDLDIRTLFDEPQDRRNRTEGKEKGWFQYLKSVLLPGLGLPFQAQEGASTPVADPWDMALKQNRLLQVSLKEPESGKEFTVATYHMPCLFGSTEKRSALAIHTSFALKAIQDFAGDKPRIFLGDYNFQPHSACYALVTTGTLPDDIPPPKEGKELPSTEPMCSAYCKKNGQEPAWTNYSQINEDPLFAETIDYIFLSPEWEVEHTEPLMDAKIQEELGPLPAGDEPSDHYMIAAELSLSSCSLKTPI